MIITPSSIAIHRFGQGAAPGELKLASDDPRGWLKAQLVFAPRQIDRLRSGQLLEPSSVYLADLIDYFRRFRRAKKSKISAARDVRGYFKRHVAPLLADHLLTRFQQTVDSDTPFQERLVHFWSNHFSVSHRNKRVIATACVGYENEAIRAHLNGYFADMLLAVESHPVMLLYLDNAQSMGPDSRLGRRRKRGLNENLAREIMELHTLGVKGGYQQADVQALANILTGWTVANSRLRLGRTGRFVFVGIMHQPGHRRLLGHRYAEAGVEQGRAALKDLARHSATANFIATKLVRHFIADNPPATAVHTVAQRFRDTQGHLPSVHQALVDLPEAWRPDHHKLKNPEDFLVSVMRGLNLPKLGSRAVLGGLNLMNQVPFTASSPAGWPDIAIHWGSPNALKKRIDWAVAAGQRVSALRSAGQLAKEMLPATGGDTPAAIERAASPQQAMGLLLASAEFQWRI